MVIFSGAKINLGLQVLSKRPDGFHDLSTCFYPIGWTDAIEVIEANITEVYNSGLSILGTKADNLVYRAWDSLQLGYGIPPVDIYCHKVVPMGAGLGGGSADAVAVLKACNQLFDIGLDNDQLRAIAIKLGSDCPFFVEAKPVLATGRGEYFTDINLDLAAYQMVVVHPGFGVSTTQAFSRVIPNAKVADLKTVLQQPISQWQGLLVNDFEPSVFAQCPAVAALKLQFIDAGAVYTSMSGSGSAVYGLFETPINPALVFGEMSWWASK
jgi:4-diphosphocytidyl-2-C-methyl-D-erythritol kinase